MAGVLCCRMLSHKAKIVSMDLVLLHSNLIICLNSLVYAPLPLFRLLDECREDPDWTDEFTVADLVQKYAASLNFAVNSWPCHLVFASATFAQHGAAKCDG